MYRVVEAQPFTCCLDLLPRGGFVRQELDWVADLVNAEKADQRQNGNDAQRLNKTAQHDFEHWVLLNKPAPPGRCRFNGAVSANAFALCRLAYSAGRA